MKITIYGDSFEDVKRQMSEIVGITPMGADMSGGGLEPAAVSQTQPSLISQDEIERLTSGQTQPPVNQAPPLEQTQPPVNQAPPVEQTQPPVNQMRPVDADGVVWDGRIHASTKTKTQDGRWKKKRGVDANLVAQVMAELQGRQSAPPINQTQAATVPSQITTIEQLSMRFGDLIAQGKIDMAGMQQIMMDTVGFSNINQLQPHQVAQVAAALESKV